jgi:GNAT superfamily N-acetyltransferase
MLEPKYCFVVDDGNGRAVGYIIGTADTENFVKKFREVFIPYMELEGLHPPASDDAYGWNENLPNALRFIMHSPENLLHLEEPPLLRDYPAHLHVDILPGFQRRGLGRQLIETFSAAVKEDGASGLHLVMAQANVEAGDFYAHTGWRRYPKVLDGGSSGEEGVKDNATWMVKRL